MKIAILTEAVETHSGSRSVIELAKSLSILKDNQLVIYARKKQSIRLFNQLKSQLKIVFIQPRSLLSLFFKYHLLFKKSDFEVIHSNAALSLFLPAALSGKKIVTTYHGTQWNIWSNKFFPYRPMFQILISPLDWATNIIIWLKTLPIFLFSKKIIGVSLYTQKEAKKIYMAEIQKIYWGSVPKNFYPTRKPKQKASTVRIISVSRITPYKGFHILIESFKKIKSSKKIELVICGSRPQKKYLKFLQKISDGAVKIIVDPPDTTLIKLYQSSDIYATCDKYLFFGMPVLEAATFGLPTVSLNYAAAPEVVKHNQTGFIANNPDELAMYLETLINNAKTRRKFSKNAQKFSRNFTWDKTAKAYEKIFQKIIREK